MIERYQLRLQPRRHQNWNPIAQTEVALEGMVGGLFSAAIARILVENAAVATSDTTAYQNFTDQVAQNMRKLWRLGTSPAFSAAKDALWEVPTGAVTGIHLGDQYTRLSGESGYRSQRPSDRIAYKSGASIKDGAIHGHEARMGYSRRRTTIPSTDQ